ncbi:nitroreductase family protein [Pseudomonas sp. MAP12]|uniref:Nitroreductase family protein n=1 Tax=Geopseudomonas aromaticivorans TaxID=2849492 RepID=A0ABS6N3K6_9GAMM|nr:nitroreductase family protein [Pseudomonas aromaticivorans]MBV2135107.1 nitroreductase family protein [Pseudomonas aromaticivorans]
MDVIELCNWRYATKKMIPGLVVPDEQVERILEAARLAPSSSGLQPYEVLVISDAALRARIQAVAKNQAQIADCSHLLVFAAWDTYTPERIRQAFEQTRRDRGELSEYWANYGKVLEEQYPVRGAEVNFQHTARQAYLALGFALLAAAAEGVDCTPMEGFDADALDDLLGLRARGLRSVVLLPLGYRDEENDLLLKLNKSRRPMAEFASELK